jgi:hypothetical protein
MPNEASGASIPGTGPIRTSIPGKVESRVRQQALITLAVETPRRWRIAKAKAAKKIDAIVALAIACVVAIEGKPKAFDAAALEVVVQLNAALTRANP